MAKKRKAAILIGKYEKQENEKKKKYRRLRDSSEKRSSEKRNMKKENQRQTVRIIEMAWRSEIDAKNEKLLAAASGIISSSAA